MYFQIMSTYTQNRSLFLRFGVTDKPCFESSHRSSITVPNDVIGNFQFQFTRILLTKTKSIVANIHRPAMQTNSKPSKLKAQNSKQSF